MKMKVAVVVPNWNGEDLIRHCLDSLQAQSYKHTIILVDNGSVDGSVGIVGDSYPNVTLLKNPKNLGFAGGVNTGIRYALEQGFDAVTLFNNDAVAAKDWLKHLVGCMESNSKIGIVTCKLMRSDKLHFDSTGDCYSIRGIPFPRGRNVRDQGQHDIQEQVFAASGGASLYRAFLFKDVGLFDEKFFAYYEDVDMSFRARLYGWDIVYNPDALAYHAVSATSSKLGSFSHYHSTKNFYFLYIKNMPTKLLLKYFPSFAYQAVRSSISSLINRRMVSYLKGMSRVVLWMPKILMERRVIQKNRKISSHDVDRWLWHDKPPISPKIS